MKNWNFSLSFVYILLASNISTWDLERTKLISKTLHLAYCLKFVESAFAFEVVLPFFGFSCWFLFAILFFVYLWCVKVKHWT